MNSPLFFGKIFRERRGIALVSVLILVVLLTAVIIGFWATSTLEYTASRSYKASSSARLMADMAVNLVQGQINEATSQGMTTAWASQPGAIRVYTNAGALQEIYKLYSAQNLTTTNVGNMDIGSAGGATATPAGTNDMPPTAWPTSPALWVDLNAPANDASGTAHFPIFNESLASTVDGFSIDTANTPGYNTVKATQPAPMPVRWLYVLQNGQIIAPDTTSTATALTFQSAPAIPSPTNPIVGRIAFWTDDETCKVNINTAGGDGILGTTGNPTDPTPIASATFWDVPRYNSPDDNSQPTSLAMSQPASGEFQRYPGHPATVALHNVLYGLGWTNNTEYGATPSGWTNVPSTNFYGLLPRYSVGGSLGATATNNIATSIPLKSSPQNHLYSSVAEMLFAPGANRPVSVLNGADSPTQQKIETARFFLTAHSRVPEVTLFGQPRISMWPEMDANDPQNLKRPRTTIDQLLAFCATNSGNTYYFTRYDPTSCSYDISLARNVTLLQYLDHFTSQAIPGYGGNFGGGSTPKYPQPGMRQILTELFDYIRTINEADCTLYNPVTTHNTLTYAQPWFTSLINSAGLYEVAPSRTDYSPTLGWTTSANPTVTTQGFGLYPRLNEVAIQFVAMGQGDSPATQMVIPPQLPVWSILAQRGIPLNPIYAAKSPPSGILGDYTSTIFSVGDNGANPLANTNPYMTDAAWEAAGYGNSPITGLPTGTTIQEVGGAVNGMMQDVRPFYDPPTNAHPNLNYKTTWLIPGNITANPNTVVASPGPPAIPGNSPCTMAVQAFLLMSFINPSQAIMNNGDFYQNGGVRPGVWMQVSGLSSLGATGVPGNPAFSYNALGFRDPGTALFYTDQGETAYGATLDTFQFWGMINQRYTGQSTSGSTWNVTNPFYSKIIPIALNSDPTKRSLYFSGGTIQVTLYDGGGLNAAMPNSSTYPSNFKVVQTGLTPKNWT